MLQTSRSGAPRAGNGDIIASELASRSASVQMLAGLAAIVLGILGVVGINPSILTPAALIVLGGTIILTGSALAGLVIGFMRSTSAPPRAVSR